MNRNVYGPMICMVTTSYTCTYGCISVHPYTVMFEYVCVYVYE